MINDFYILSKECFLLHRFFVEPCQVTDGTIIINGDDVKHISKVLRLCQKDNITVCDCAGHDYTCQIQSISSDEVVAAILEKTPSQTEPPVNVTIYQGMPKSDKMDYIVQKCVELGAIAVVPVITKRTIAIPRDEEKKIARWQKIAAEAAKQCGRGIIPAVERVMSFKDMIKSLSDDDLNILPYESEKDLSLKNILDNTDRKNINIIIGPEGGFDESEVVLAKEKNVSIVTLGPRILRTETAPLAALSAVMYQLGDW